MTHWHIGPNFHNFVQRVMDWIRMEITSNLLTHNDSCEEVRPMKSLDLYKLSPSKTTKLIFAWFTSTRDMGGVDAKDAFIWLLMKVFTKTLKIRFFAKFVLIFGFFQKINQKINY